MGHKRHKGKTMRAKVHAHNSTPQSAKSARSFRSTSLASPHAHFTMADEGRNTERHHDAFLPGTKLRDHSIVFVSSGQLVGASYEQLDISGHELEQASMSEADDSLIQHNNAPTIDAQAVETLSPLDRLHDLNIDAGAKRNGDKIEINKLDGAQDTFDFVIDTIGNRSGTYKHKPKHKVHARPPLQSDIDSVSDSDADVVLFQGRRRPVVLDDPPVHETATKEDTKTESESVNAPNEPHVTDALVSVLGVALERDTTRSDVHPKLIDLSKPDIGWAGVRPRYKDALDGEWVHGDGTLGMPDGTHIEDLWETDRSEPRQMHRAIKPARMTAKQRRAAEEEAALQDYIANMSDKDNFDIPKGRLDLDTPGWATEPDEDSEDDTEIDDTGIDDASIDDETMTAIVEGLGSDSSDLEVALDEIEREQWEDDEDLRIRYRDAMTDEQLARILAKQESLGIDTDDVYLLDDSGFGDLEEARAGLAILAESSKARTSRTKGRPPVSSTRDDAYGDFDIMDYDRPSLKVKKPSRKSGGRASLNRDLEELSDEELMATLESSWQADRRAKRLKKAEREELRSAGLLGRKKSGKVDMSRLYDEGMRMGDIRAVLQEFLSSKEDSKAFPPMGHEARKELHTIAHAFALTSKSRGNGNDRFVVYAKTKRTVRWSEARWTVATRAVTRSFLPNPKASGSGRGKKSGTRGAGGADSGTSYRHGEVVGASAPEISADNFGRKLMEKMGWSHGMALGKPGESTENRLLAPVQATIKMGRGGLG